MQMNRILSPNTTIPSHLTAAEQADAPLMQISQIISQNKYDMPVVAKELDNEKETETVDPGINVL